MYRCIKADNEYGTPDTPRNPNPKKKIQLTRDILVEALNMYISKLIYDNRNWNISRIIWNEWEGGTKFLSPNTKNFPTIRLYISKIIMYDGSEYTHSSRGVDWPFRLLIDVDPEIQRCQTAKQCMKYIEDLCSYNFNKLESFATSVVGKELQSNQSSYLFIEKWYSNLISNLTEKLHIIDKSWSCYDDDPDYTQYNLDRLNSLEDGGATSIFLNLGFNLGDYKDLLYVNNVICLSNVFKYVTKSLNDRTHKIDKYFNECIDKFIKDVSEYSDMNTNIQKIISVYRNDVIPNIEEDNPDWSISLEVRDNDIVIHLDRTDNFTYGGKEIIVKDIHISNDKWILHHIGNIINDKDSFILERSSAIEKSINKALNYRKKNYGSNL